MKKMNQIVGEAKGIFENVKPAEATPSPNITPGNTSVASASLRSSCPICTNIREFAQSHQSNWWLLSPVCSAVIQLEIATMQSSPQGLYMVAKRPREICWLQRKNSGYQERHNETYLSSLAL
jgi:phage terminase large subunit GpA-like protein